MIRLPPIALLRTALLVPALALAAPGAHAAPGGRIGVLPQGRYACETGGDATAAVGVRQAESDFTVTRGSSYRTAQGKGLYLFTGERVTFSTGPFAGRTMRQVRDNFLRFTGPDGADSDLRCIRRPGSHG